MTCIHLLPWLGVFKGKQACTSCLLWMGKGLTKKRWLSKQILLCTSAVIPLTELQGACL